MALLDKQAEAIQIIDVEEEERKQVEPPVEDAQKLGDDLMNGAKPHRTRNHSNIEVLNLGSKGDGF